MQEWYGHLTRSGTQPKVSKPTLISLSHTSHSIHSRQLIYLRGKKGQYLVHWASKFYSSSDPSHTGTPGADIIRYAYTSDFRTFSTPQTLITAGKTSLIDLAYVQLGANSYARFLKNESATNVYMERSDTGLFGTWTRPGGGNTFIHSGVEGPYAWRDNVVEGRVNLLLDCKCVHI